MVLHVPPSTGMMAIYNKASGFIGAYNKVDGANVDTFSGLPGPNYMSYGMSQIAVDSAGNIWAAGVDSTSSTVRVISSADGGATWTLQFSYTPTWKPALRWDMSVAVDSQDNIFVSYETQNTVSPYNGYTRSIIQRVSNVWSNTDLVNVATQSGGQGMSLAVDSHDDVYCALVVINNGQPEWLQIWKRPNGGAWAFLIQLTNGLNQSGGRGTQPRLEFGLDDTLHVGFTCFGDSDDGGIHYDPHVSYLQRSPSGVWSPREVPWQADPFYINNEDGEYLLNGPHFVIQGSVVHMAIDTYWVDKVGFYDRSRTRYLNRSAAGVWSALTTLIDLAGVIAQDSYTWSGISIDLAGTLWVFINYSTGNDNATSNYAVMSLVNGGSAWTSTVVTAIPVQLNGVVAMWSPSVPPLLPTVQTNPATGVF